MSIQTDINLYQIICLWRWIKIRYRQFSLITKWNIEGTECKNKKIYIKICIVCRNKLNNSIKVWKLKLISKETAISIQKAFCLQPKKYNKGFRCNVPNINHPP